jgi:peptidoglycan hydrolase-like protein with peptidoglycan-binding domain
MKQKKLILAGLMLSGSMSLALQPAWAQSGSGARDVPGSPGKQTIPEKIQPGTAGSAGKARPGMGHQGTAGMSAEDIKKIEQALQAKGHNPGPVDGVMDEKTRQALRAFQKANNLSATGVLDQQTAAKLGVQLGAGSSGATGLSGSTESSGASQKGSSGLEGESKAGSQRGSSGSGYGGGSAGSGK